jgi:hypothetical protein
VPVAQDGFGVEPLDDLGSGLPGGVDEYGVQDGPGRAVERVRRPVLLQSPVQHGGAGVEADLPCRRNACGDQPVEEPPAGEPVDAGGLQLVAGQGVAGEAAAVDRRDAQALPCQQESGSSAREPGSDDDDVVLTHHGSPVS